MSFQFGNTPDGPVPAGIDTLLLCDNKIISYATDMNVSYSFNTEGIITLGHFGPREFKSLGYNLDLTIGTFILRGKDLEGALPTPGFNPETGLCEINKSGLYTFTALDLHSLIVLFTVIGCKLDGGDISTAQGSLNTHQTRWKGYALLPGLQTS